MTFLERRKYGGKLPSASVGLILGVCLLLTVGSLILPSSGDAATNSLCQGQFPCFSPAACQKAGGAYTACPDRCGSSNRGYCFTQQEPVPLTIRIGSVTQVVDLGAYVQAVYTYAIGLAAILAAVMLMIGGAQWLTSAGDAGRVSAAKTRITNAIVGLLLVVFAWVFLNTINPALVRLQMPRIPMVKKVGFVQCEEFKMLKACGQRFGLVENEDVAEDAPVTERYEMTDDVDGPDVITECVGASCSLAGSQDGINSCQQLTDNITSTGDCSGCAEGYDCRPCKQAGQTCDGAGVDPSCCGGYCSPGAVSLAEEISAGGQGLEGAITLNIFREIQQGVVDATPDWYMSMLRRLGMSLPADAGFVCHNGRLGRPCLLNTECQSDKCVATDGSPLGGSCQSGAVGAVCADDADCNGMACVESTCVPRVRGGYCEDNDDCPSGSTCVDPGDGKAKYCSNVFIQMDIDALDGHECGPSTNIQCSNSYRCDSVDAKYRCISGEPGTACTDDRHCRAPDGTQLGTCFINAFDTDQVGVCVVAAPGSGCDFEPGGLPDCTNPADRNTAMMCAPLLTPDNAFINNPRGVCLPRDTNSPCIVSGSVDTCITSSTGLVCPEGSYTCLPQSGQ